LTGGETHGQDSGASQDGRQQTDGDSERIQRPAVYSSPVGGGEGGSPTGDSLPSRIGPELPAAVINHVLKD
jgi:hypothetical protein